MRTGNVNIQLYSSCNCDCEFCHFKDRNFIKIDPKFVLDFLKKNKEITEIVITGGEPTFAIDEYVAIVKNLDKNKRHITLQTNGWWGDNESIKEQIKLNPPSSVQLSVDEEKQKYIDIDVVRHALDFLKKNNIATILINHTNDDKEFDKYKSLFGDDVRRGIIVESGTPESTDCGIALLATNKVGRLNIEGWN